MYCLLACLLPYPLTSFPPGSPDLREIFSAATPYLSLDNVTHDRDPASQDSGATPCCFCYVSPTYSCRIASSKRAALLPYLPDSGRLAQDRSQKGQINKQQLTSPSSWIALSSITILFNKYILSNLQFRTYVMTSYVT